jgi:hypothetical protein
MTTGRFVDAELEVVQGRKCVVFWFVDGSSSPFRLLLDCCQIDRAMVPTKTRRPLLIYTRDGLVQRTMIRKVINRR